jgi:organic radical activating enzyme
VKSLSPTGANLESIVRGIFAAWGQILAGRHPNLSIEITRECPLRCPGCYAYAEDHLGGGTALRDVRDLRGEQLVHGVLALLYRTKPIHVSIVGGEPLVRYRELNELLPRMAAMGIHTQVVTSAVRPVPLEWASLRRFQLVVSVDGLQPEHDLRRAPATYERILKHIAGHQVTVHCTVTRQMVQREGYLREFMRFWSGRPETKRIWVSLYTPQRGEISAERLLPGDRQQVVKDLLELRKLFPKLETPKGLLEVYARPPQSPSDCIFAKTTPCLGPDLSSRIEPCQLGGKPVCNECGCIASAGLKAIGRHRLPGGLPVESVFDASLRLGALVRWLREPAGQRQRSKKTLPVLQE